MNLIRSVFVLFPAVSSLKAQQQDTARLNPVIVTAERTQTPISWSTAAASRITAAQIARTPHATIADLLKQAPGFSIVHADGLGYDPQLIVRGFYGGGEAEYVIVMVDGRPVNQVHTGVVAWNVLPPLSSIEGIDVVRGGTSALYGDAAIGGVINILTRTGMGAATPPAQWDVTAGSFGAVRLSGDIVERVAEREYSIKGGYDKTNGSRAHSDRTAWQLGGSFALIDQLMSKLTLTARTEQRDFDEPGALIQGLLDVDRDASDPLFRFDHTKDQTNVVGLGYSRLLAPYTRVSASVNANFRNGNAVRTLALAPGFGDTQDRDFDHSRLSASVQLEARPGRGQLVVGAEFGAASSESKYYAVVTGDRDAYASANGTRGLLASASDVGRINSALFGQYVFFPNAAVRLTMGARVDRYDDEQNNAAAGGGDPPVDSDPEVAFSPKVGVNVRLFHTDRAAVHLYATGGRSFKAPTLDQRWDARLIPVPFPPFQLQTSNFELKSQYGTNVEGGIYYTRIVGTYAVAASLSVYQMMMRDEIDFDVTTLSYVNIGKSKHAGAEAGVRIDGGLRSGFVNYTLQAAKAESGDNSGNYLKAIPRHQISAGYSSLLYKGLTGSLTLTSVHKTFIDDANTTELPSHTTADVQVSLPWRHAKFYIEARNIFGTKYNSSGFFDPNGSGEVYYYPAAGTVLMAGLRSAW